MNSRLALCGPLVCLLLSAGCSQPQEVRRPPVVEQAHVTEPNAAAMAQEAVKMSVAAGPVLFVPVKIGILPLTELSGSSGTEMGGKLDVLVALLDAFGCQMKAPGVLRFELYEYVPRSAQLKGQRLTLWPDIDLTGPVENNRYWRDFMRAYEFELDTQASRDKTYILEATCLCPDGRRLSSQYTLKGSL